MAANTPAAHINSLPASLNVGHSKQTLKEGNKIDRSIEHFPPKTLLDSGETLHVTVFWLLTGVKSDMPWKKPGTPGSVTVMEGAAPDPGPPGPPAPPSREPRSRARLPSGLPSAAWPTEAVLVVWVDVCPEVLAEGGGGDVVEESEEEEVEKED